MKKLIFPVLTLMFMVPAIADVAITAIDLGDQKLQLNFTSTGGAVVRGVALKLTITGGHLANSSAYIFSSPSFNTFVDYAFSYAAGYTIGAGHPLANPTAAGVPVFPATTVSISTGFLDPSGTQAGLSSGVVATLQLSGLGDSGGATVAITADTLRGGPVIGENLGNVTVQAAQGISVTTCNDCMKCTAPYYAAWVSFGKPACWCYQKHCRGDADGLKQSSKTGSWPVGTNDLNILVPVWQVQGNIGTGICADFAKDAQSSKTGSWRVGTNDLNLLIANWQVFDASVPVCEGTNFNFWTH